ncbi:hypothetical protein [Actinoplanes solisilvae]|uniref:hypothetical protein n=1 Tax=Actinoplanes solisilvae TaxID=2486853 RepID=UPI000FDC13A4|nr:hypothetical protein [Actinoplanes solisilvae]
MLNRDRRIAGAADLVGAGSAMAVGVFGWLAAHTLNFWIIAHSHHGALSTTERHVHQATAAATIVAGGLATAALVTAALVGGHRAAPRRSTVHVAVGLSAAAFLGADTIEHTLLGIDSTPPQAILLGLLLHAGFGAVSSLYWLRFTDSVCSLATPATTSPAEPAARPEPAEHETPRRRRLVWAYAVAGRAPPAC